jgi:Pyruvate phosphate dikinase, AMP/ATP-binding domain
VVVAAGCGGQGPKGRTVTPPRAESVDGFVDYTSARVESVESFEQLAAVPAVPAVPGQPAPGGPAAGPGERPLISGAKFVITGFSDPARRQMHFLDGRFYRFHDEWAWFRLLKGQAVAGLPPLPRVASEVAQGFATPEDVRRWAATHEEQLPEWLEVMDGRLYARRFYEVSLVPSGRELGAGSLIHVAARAGRPELWGFELEYSDPARVEDLLVFWDALDEAVPAPARGQLRWFARSVEQLGVGRELLERRPSLKGRVLTYAEVSVPGETQVYTSGVVAGRLRAFRELSRLADAEPEDILLLGALPEYLPQARGLVTAIPQTPLSHLNLLAKSRQIVNAYRGGVLDDPEVQDLVRSRAPVALSAEDGELRLHRLTEAQYARWLDAAKSEPPVVASVEWKSAPYLVDLSKVELSRLPKLEPLLGGKNAGMVRLLHGLGPGTAPNGAGTLRVDVPDRPLGLTIRAYREHLAALRPELEALIADENFQKFKKLRFLALEGAEEFVEKFPSRRDRDLAKSYQNPNALGAIAAVVRKGGVVHLVRHAPLPLGLKTELERVLPAHFSAYSAEQGLRFRSSSTVEDIEGFNGAGLYDSSTGYLVPRKGTKELEKRPGVADAVRKTWASYFSFEAFEERHQSRIDHLAADMAVLVHARFDDELERANGVFTFSLGPDGGELAVDAQPGAVSVTNPPTDRVVIPESSRVRRADGAWSVSRQTLSSLAQPGERVMNDAELRELYEVAERLARQQLAEDNAGVPGAQQRRALVLDFEFRRVAAGWPASRQGQMPARFVVKQMRPLEPSPRVGRALREAPIPRAALSRARRIETRVCRGGGLELSALLVYTNPDAAPDLGYSRRPLLAGLGVTRRGEAGRVFTHLQQRSAVVRADGWAVELAPGVGLSAVRVEGGVATLVSSTGAKSESRVGCETVLDFAEPRELLRSFIDEGRAADGPAR